jgi:pilus assembly protein Flp/PilA
MSRTLSKTLQSTVAQLVTRFARDQNGATAIEYALIAAGVAVAVATTVYSLGSTTKGLFTSIASKL